MRIAIVATSAQLRASLAAALRATPEFEIVSLTSSEDRAAAGADVVIIARPTARVATATTAGHHDIVDAPVLTNREREILALLADGLGNKQIAARLHISANTVKTHLELLFEKLGVSSRAEAVAVGVRQGLLLL